MIRRLADVECDGCFRPAHQVRRFAGLAREDAMRDGWTVTYDGRGNDLCPLCAAKREGSA